MKVIAHTPVGKFTVDYGDTRTRDDLKSEFKGHVSAEPKSFTISGVNDEIIILGSDTVKNSVFEIVD